MASDLFRTKSFSNMLTYCQLYTEDIFKKYCVWNSKVFIHWNTFENVFRKMASILSRHQPVQGENINGCQVFRLPDGQHFFSNNMLFNPVFNDDHYIDSDYDSNGDDEKMNDGKNYSWNHSYKSLWKLISFHSIDDKNITTVMIIKIIIIILIRMIIIVVLIMMMIMIIIIK